MVRSLLLVAGIVGALAVSVASAQGRAPSPPRPVASAPGPSAPAPAALSGEFLRRSEQILREAAEVMDPNRSVLDPRNIEDADRIARRAAPVVAAPLRQVAPDVRLPNLGDHRPSGLGDALRAQAEAGRRQFIFLSDSLSDGILKAALNSASETGAVIVYRGVRKGAKFLDAFKRLHSLSKGITPVPTAQIDPRVFDSFNIGVVPAVVISEGPDFVKVSGTVSLVYAKTRFENSAFGDAGTRGDTYEIVETDFIEELKDRVSKIDFDAKKRDAQARLWNNMTFHELPLAPKASRRMFDPTVRIQDSIVTPDGVTIAPAGAFFNPLDILPFKKVMIAFDASDPLQLRYAKRVADEALASNRGAVLMTTRIDRARGFDAFGEYSSSLFPHRLYLLDSVVATRFGILHIPTIVQASGRLFQVDEIDVKELQQ